MKKLSTILFVTTLTVSVFGQKLAGEYKRQHLNCVSCTEFLSLKKDGTYNRTVTFDWGDNNYIGTWKLINDKLILTEKDTLKKGFYLNKEFCIIKKSQGYSLPPTDGIFRDASILDSSNSYCIYPCPSILTFSAFGQTDTSKYAIIPFAIADDWLFPESKPSTLILNDIKDIEILLKQCIDNYNTELKQKKINIDDTINLVSYKRQYIAVINKKGEKEVWINCFCNDTYNPPKSDWTKELIIVYDGGKCYFNLKINLATKKYYDIIVNSPW